MIAIPRFMLYRLSDRLRPPRIIRDSDPDLPYLSRWYMRGAPVMPDGSSPFDALGDPFDGAIDAEGVGVYLHRFHRSDMDRELHNHPWAWSVSLILAGGYREERRLNDECRCTHGIDRHRDGMAQSPHAPGLIVPIARGGACTSCSCERFRHRVAVRLFKPGMVNVIRADDFHRVDLLESDAWSLFIAGPKTGKSWGFWERDSGHFVPWKAIRRIQDRMRDLDKYGA